MGRAGDWHKMSGTTLQPHTDSQQTDVIDCMIRERTGSHKTERSIIFRELFQPSEISYRLGLNRAPTKGLLCFVLVVRLNIYLLTKVQQKQLLMVVFSLLSVTIISQKTKKSKRTSQGQSFSHACIPQKDMHNLGCTTTGALARVRYLRGESQTEEHLLHVDESECFSFALVNFILIYGSQFL